MSQKHGTYMDIFPSLSKSIQRMCRMSYLIEDGLLSRVPSDFESGLSLLSVSEFSASLLTPWLCRRLRSCEINISFKQLNGITEIPVRLYSIGKLLTSRGIGSSDSSIRTTWLILGLFSGSGSTHLKAIKSARLSTRVDGLVSILGSTTSSERLLPTIILSQSTRFTYNHHETIL